MTTCKESGSTGGRGCPGFAVSVLLAWFPLVTSLNCNPRNAPLNFCSAVEFTVFSLIYIPCNPLENPVKYGIMRISSLGMEKLMLNGNSLVVWWLGLRVSTAGGMGSIPCPGSKISHVTWHGQKGNKEADA